ncbi:hypothetical protein DFH27DRAFT_609071 [Peziza echinospora]|nr:hypothetical protein DFH27DRAFT_609071 [Peziza echinospora]
MVYCIQGLHLARPLPHNSHPVYFALITEKFLTPAECTALLALTTSDIKTQWDIASEALAEACEDDREAVGCVSERLRPFWEEFGVGIVARSGRVKGEGKGEGGSGHFTIKEQDSHLFIRSKKASKKVKYEYHNRIIMSHQQTHHSGGHAHGGSRGGGRGGRGRGRGGHGGGGPPAGVPFTENTQGYPGHTKTKVKKEYQTPQLGGQSGFVNQFNAQSFGGHQAVDSRPTPGPQQRGNRGRGGIRGGHQSGVTNATPQHLHQQQHQQQFQNNGPQQFATPNNHQGSSRGRGGNQSGSSNINHVQNGAPRAGRGRGGGNKNAPGMHNNNNQFQQNFTTPVRGPPNPRGGRGSVQAGSRGGYNQSPTANFPSHASGYSNSVIDGSVYDGPAPTDFTNAPQYNTPHNNNQYQNQSTPHHKKPGMANFHNSPQSISSYHEEEDEQPLYDVFHQTPPPKRQQTFQSRDYMESEFRASKVDPEVNPLSLVMTSADKNLLAYIYDSPQYHTTLEGMWGSDLEFWMNTRNVDHMVWEVTLPADVDLPSQQQQGEYWEQQNYQPSHQPPQNAYVQDQYYQEMQSQPQYQTPQYQTPQSQNYHGQYQGMQPQQPPPPNDGYGQY